MTDLTPHPDTIARLRAEFEAELAAAGSDRALQAVRDLYLARKGGVVAGLMKAVAAAAPADRPALGRLANELKTDIEARVADKRAALEEARPPAGAVDVTLPGRVPLLGHRHPLTVVRDRMEEIFTRMGFAIVEGPELEDEWHCFDALNMPAEHPARDMQDTLYLASPLAAEPATSACGPREESESSSAAARASDSLEPERRGWSPGAMKNDGAARALDDVAHGRDPRTLLRTHTSAMQIRYMQTHQPPIRIVVPGRVYRRDDLDLTHTPMFSQMEGLAVGEGISLADLKGTLLAWARDMFGSRSRLRFRPSFFPYTEPSAEVDISCWQCDGAGCRMCKRTGWLEVLGCGMVHPAVFEAVGYDTERYTGFAWGIGMERVAMLRYQVDDIRLFFENDLRFLEQFPY